MRRPRHSARIRPLAVALLCAGVAFAGHAETPAGHPERAASTDAPDGAEIARRTNARDDGVHVTRVFEMELVTKRGKVRRRVTRFFRRDFGDERRSVLFFEEPPSLEGTALLSYDYPEFGREDDQWIYLPALRKSRRIATGDRGRSFLGTDFSYEDIKKDTRLGIDDYRWENAGRAVQDGVECWLLEGVPVDEATAYDLGYGRVLYYIDAEIWIARRADYWTVAGDPLKTVTLSEIRQVDGIWTTHRIEAENLRSGHRTHLIFRDVDYGEALSDELFAEAALSRGSP